jgi:hypothetical protein
MGRTSGTLLVSIILALLEAMVIIFPTFWKYLVSVNILLVAPLSIGQVSALVIWVPLGMRILGIWYILQTGETNIHTLRAINAL